MVNRQTTHLTGANRLMVSLRSEQREKLQLLAEKSHISESQAIRLIVEEFLEKHDGKEVRFQLTVKDSSA